jgi:hypothetical protein
MWIIAILLGMPFALIGWIIGFVGFALKEGYKAGYNYLPNI